MTNQRVHGPKINAIQNVQLPKVTNYILKNGIQVFEVDGGTQEVLKLEILIESGRIYETARTASRAVASLLKEGCEGYNAEELARVFEYYGASLSTSSDFDFSRVTLYCLTKYFENLAPILYSVLSKPTFSESELSLFKSNVTQRLEVDLTKNDVLAYRAFTQSIFGKDHPYGYNSTIENYNNLTTTKLNQEHNSNYGSERCTIFLSGNINNSVRKVLEESLGALRPTNDRIQKTYSSPSLNPNKLNLKSSNSFQSAIRIGRRLFTRHHKDYLGMSVLTTLLGGYFGSRLMSNIREEKGYTYNIYSSIDNLLHDGYFFIGTEVGKKYTQKTVEEIYYELEKLRTELCPENELQMVKNYIAGNYLNELDGPLKSSRIVRSLVSAKLPTDYFDNAFQEMLDITPDKIKLLAEKYLNPKMMTIVVVE